MFWFDRDKVWYITDKLRLEQPGRFWASLGSRDKPSAKVEGMGVPVSPTAAQVYHGSPAGFVKTELTVAED
eukprot:SAG11_NODE_9264_length_927_cov_2.298309_2_plen_71_part_00